MGRVGRKYGRTGLRGFPHEVGPGSDSRTFSASFVPAGWRAPQIHRVGARLPSASMRYGIRSIPFFGRFEHGKLVKTVVGAVGRDGLKALAA